LRLHLPADTTSVVPLFPAKLVYVGNFEPTHSTETHISATLSSLGIDVIEAQENQVGAQNVIDLVREHEAEVLLWTRTWGVKDGARMLEGAREAGAVTVAWHLDLYAGLPRGNGIKTDPWWRCDYVFTPDGGSPGFWQKHGIAHHYLKPGVFRPECYLARPDPALACDVLFVGSGGIRGNYHPEWSYRGELIKFLSDTYGPRFAKWGNPPMNGGRAHVRGHALNVLYASAKIVVGDALCLGPGEALRPRFRHERYWSDRVCETMGRGGFLIHPWIAGLDEEFENGKHLLYYPYGDFEALKALIDDWTLEGTAERRERVRLAGHEKVKRDCTYTNRAIEVFAKVLG